MSKCQKCKNGCPYVNGLFYCSTRNNVVCMNDCEYFVGKSKYNNQKTKIGSITFDSKKESQRFQELVLQIKSDQISDLERQVKFQIIPKTETERAAYYVADFVYYDKKTKTAVIEDVKSQITKRNPAYILKRKLIKHLYPQYEFRES